MVSEVPTHERPVYQERWEIVQEEIRRRILVGEMLPGSSIPETDLAESLGVSRGPVREALRALEVKGLVSRRPRRTSIVTPITRRDVDELYSLRAEVECLAIRAAIEKNPAGVAAELRRTLDVLSSTLEGSDGQASTEADIEFHGAFYRCSEHLRLQGVWETLQDPLRIMMRITNKGSEDSWRSSMEGHEEIAKAAIAGDIQGTQQATRRHLELARERLQPFVEE